VALRRCMVGCRDRRSRSRERGSYHCHHDGQHEKAPQRQERPHPHRPCPQWDSEVRPAMWMAASSPTKHPNTARLARPASGPQAGARLAAMTPVPIRVRKTPLAILAPCFSACARRISRTPCTTLHTPCKKPKGRAASTSALLPPPKSAMDVPVSAASIPNPSFSRPSIFWSSEVPRSPRERKPEPTRQLRPRPG